MAAQFITRISCPACQAPAGTPVFSCAFDQEPIKGLLMEFYHLDREVDFPLLEGGQYCLFHCLQCGCVYQRDSPTGVLLETLYSRWIDPELSLAAFKKNHNQEDDARFKGQCRTLMHWLGKPAKQCRMLDFGMGWGAWAGSAKALGIQIFGMEVDGDRVAAAEKAGITMVDWQNAKDQAFDVIRAEQVFEHLGNPAEVLQKLVSLLAPGGLLVLGVPWGQDIMKRLENPDWRAPKTSKKSLNPVHPLEHLNCFTTEALLRLGQGVGLQPVSPDLASRWTGLPKGSPTGWVKGLLRPIKNALAPWRQEMIFSFDGSS